MTKPATTAPSRSIILRDTEVRALLADGTVQVRRPVKPQPHECHNGDLIYRDRLIGSATPERSWSAHGPYEEAYGVCPFDAPGTVLWVCETWWSDRREPGVAVYDVTPEWGKYRDQVDPIRSTHPDETLTTREEARAAMLPKFWTEQPPSTMPAWASRLDVQTTEVSVERIDGEWTWVGTFRRVEATPSPAATIRDDDGEAD